MQTRLSIALLPLGIGILKDIAALRHGGQDLDAKVWMKDGAKDAKGRW